MKQWWAPYCITATAREHEHARSAQAEADSLRAQQLSRRPARSPHPPGAQCPARALALVDDCSQLFPILLAWRRALGRELTGWAGQVEADDVESLPRT
ncbi:hypothetical protein [Streptomyces sp. NPDC003996]